jgi:tripeptide aminopeptidase
MINAVRVAANLIERFQKDKLPETTEGKQGYLHPYQISGDVGKIVITCLVRDFEDSGLIVLEEILAALAKETEKLFPGAKITIDNQFSYRNMKQELDKHPHVMDLARQAMESVGVKPLTRPIRGGTDGSRLTLMGLPTPNIFAGGENFHSVKEYVSIQTMEKACDVILGIATLAQEKAAKGEI